MTAQDVYKAMLRDEVAPALRGLGFKGSGREFELPSDTHWVQLGFQASQFSDAQSVKFTVNLAVVRRDVWDKASSEHNWMGRKPKANTVSGVQVWGRLGEAMPGGEDHWWSVTPTTDTSALSDEVVSAVRDFGLSALMKRVQATTEALAQEPPETRWS